MTCDAEHSVDANTPERIGRKFKSGGGVWHDLNVRLTPLAQLQPLRYIETPAANAPADAVPSRFRIVVRTAKVDNRPLFVPSPRCQQKILCESKVERQPCAEDLAVQCFTPHSKETANKTLMPSTGAGLLCLMGGCFDHVSCGFEFCTGHAPVLA